MQHKIQIALRESNDPLKNISFTDFMVDLLKEGAVFLRLFIQSAFGKRLNLKSQQAVIQTCFEIQVGVELTPDKYDLLATHFHIRLFDTLCTHRKSCKIRFLSKLPAIKEKYRPLRQYWTNPCLHLQLRDLDQWINTFSLLKTGRKCVVL